MTTRTLTTVAVTAGHGRDVHYGIQVRDSDRERPYSGLDARCGSDRGRNGSVQAMLVVDGPVTCGKCLRRTGEFLGRATTFDRL